MRRKKRSNVILLAFNEIKSKADVNPKKPSGQLKATNYIIYIYFTLREKYREKFIINLTSSKFYSLESNMKKKFNYIDRLIFTKHYFNVLCVEYNPGKFERYIFITSYNLTNR